MALKPNGYVSAIREQLHACATVTILLFGATAAWTNPTGASPPDPTGEWLVANAVARIRIVDCEGRRWGVVSWEMRPGIDSNNPDHALRSRPTLEMPILLGMAQSKSNEWEGQIYNSQDGHIYSANISLVNPGTLRVRGCFLGVLCGGENWTRVPPPNIAGVSPPPTFRSTSSPPSAAANSATSDLTESDEDICLRLVGPPRRQKSVKRVRDSRAPAT